MLGTVLQLICPLSWESSLLTHFTDDETEVQGGEVTCPSSHSYRGGLTRDLYPQQMFLLLLNCYINSKEPQGRK